MTCAGSRKGQPITGSVFRGNEQQHRKINLANSRMGHNESLALAAIHLCGEACVLKKVSELISKK